MAQQETNITGQRYVHSILGDHVSPRRLYTVSPRINMINVHALISEYRLF